MGGASSAGDAIERAAGALKKRGRIVLVSDMLEVDDGERLVAAVARLRARGDEVVALRVLTATEAGLRSGSAARYFDPERPQVSATASLTADGALAERVRAYYAALATRLAERGAEFVPLFTDEPLELALRRWIASHRSLAATVTPSTTSAALGSWKRALTPRTFICAAFRSG